MKFQATFALLAPLAIAIPFWKQAKVDEIPELSVKEWQSVQSGFIDGVKQLSDWSWETAAEIVGEVGEVAVKDEEKTIWVRLQEDPDFSRLVKLFKFEKKGIKFLDDKDFLNTILAPTNEALTPPNNHGHHGHGHHGHDDITETSTLAEVSAWLEAQPASILEDHDGDDDEDRKKRREIIRKILDDVLAYHLIGGSVSAREIGQNSTFETAMDSEDGSYDGVHKRVKVERTFLPPGIKVNEYARTERVDIKCVNGYIHSINHALLPPPSIIDAAFLFPDFFSIATSAIQKVHGRKYLDWKYLNLEDKAEGSLPDLAKSKGMGLTSFFLPSNVAFGLLPPRLKLFLFSPFGERALEAVLRYHSIPNVLLHTEFVHPPDEDPYGRDGEEIAPNSDDISFHREFDFETALNGTKLHVDIDKHKVFNIDGAYKNTLTVNGQHVGGIDYPAWNGAFHIIDKLLIPPHKHHDKHGVDVAHLDSWENWEEWLPSTF